MPLPPLSLRILPGLAVTAAALLAPGLPALAAAPSPAQLQALEGALNSREPTALDGLLKAGPGLDPAQLKARRGRLIENFPDARWQVRQGSPLRDGRPTVTIKVVGSRRQGDVTYLLDAEQRVALDSDQGRISGQELLREQSILRSGEKSPPVSLLIPDAVLTGQSYDVDVIFDEPLDGALTAGGITALSPDQVASMESPSIELGALAGGGLFKTVRAPLQPGHQTWAVLLVHPEGVVSATKRVRVVQDRRALEP
jgi:hypothetical protein